jgi:hypothetical protein
LFDPGNEDPNYILDHRYNQDYYNADGTATIILPDNNEMTIETRSLPDVDPNKRYFALVAKYPPMVSTRDGTVILYFKDALRPWLAVGEFNIENGDFFITYPDRRMYLWIGGMFVELLTSSSGIAGGRDGIDGRDGTGLDGKDGEDGKDGIGQDGRDGHDGLGGTENYFKYDGYFIKNETIDNSKLVTHCILAKNISPKAVTTEKLADKSVTTEKLGDGIITENHFTPNINIAQKISSKSITNTKLVPGPDFTVKYSKGQVVLDGTMSELIEMMVAHGGYNAFEKLTHRIIDTIMSQSTLKNKFASSLCMCATEWKPKVGEEVETHVLTIAPHTDRSVPALGKMTLPEVKKSLSYIK